MMNSNSHRTFRLRVCGIPLVTTLAVAVLLSIPQILPAANTSSATEPIALPEKPGEPGASRTSSVRAGELETKDGLTLRLTADIGSVKITPNDSGSRPVVRYTVHVETDARGSVATQLLNNYGLKARSTAGGVEISGAFAPKALRSANAQVWVQFEVAIPRNYS